MAPLKANVRTIRFITAITALAALAACHYLGTQTTREFVSRVQLEIRNGAVELDLSKLMPGKWETVCNIDGYDGPTFVKKYGRTYPPAGEARDGAWGLTFINPDGSYDSVAGSRGDGFDLDFGCMDRANAILIRKPGEENLWIERHTADKLREPNSGTSDLSRSINATCLSMPASCGGTDENNQAHNAVPGGMHAAAYGICHGCRRRVLSGASG